MEFMERQTKIMEIMGGSKIMGPPAAPRDYDAPPPPLSAIIPERGSIIAVHGADAHRLAARLARILASRGGSVRVSGWLPAETDELDDARVLPRSLDLHRLNRGDAIVAVLPAWPSSLNAAHMIRLCTDAPSVFICAAAPPPCWWDACAVIEATFRGVLVEKSNLGGDEHRRRWCHVESDRSWSIAAPAIRQPSPT